MLTAEELIPDPAERERIFREACERVAADRAEWFTIEEAATFLRCGRSSMYRLISVYGVPTCEIVTKVPTIWRRDLEALQFARMNRRRTALIEFPSQAREPESGSRVTFPSKAKAA